MGTTRLDTLPTELIRKIAVYTTPRTNLSLSCVSHTIRNACYDPLVFLELLQNQTWVARNLDVRRDDAEFIARYAMAEAATLEFSLPQVDEDDWDFEIVRSLRYLPSMAILGNIPNIPEYPGDELSHLSCLMQTLRNQQKWRSFHSMTNGTVFNFAIYVACYLMKGEYLTLLLSSGTATIPSSKFRRRHCRGRMSLCVSSSLMC
jgi:hypothetical protein